MIHCYVHEVVEWKVSRFIKNWSFQLHSIDVPKLANTFWWIDFYISKVRLLGFSNNTSFTSVHIGWMVSLSDFIQNVLPLLSLPEYCCGRNNSKCVQCSFLGLWLRSLTGTLLVNLMLFFPSLFPKWPPSGVWIGMLKWTVLLPFRRKIPVVSLSIF